MRRIPQTDAALRAGHWATPLGPVLYGKTLGIVGFGRQGRYVARLGNAFGMRVLAWSPHLTPALAAGCGATHRDLDQLLGDSDAVTIHVALNSGSRGLLDDRRLRLMRATAFLINTRAARSLTKARWSMP